MSYTALTFLRHNWTRQIFKKRLFEFKMLRYPDVESSCVFICPTGAA